MQLFNDYINQLVGVKDELEHSGRTFLQNLLSEFAKECNVEIKHEPKRDKQGRGAPDFKFLFNDTDIGYLENKKIGEDLDEVLKCEQIRKYKTLTDNLILTDYIRWIWIYKGEVVKDLRLCEKTDLEQKVIKLNEEKCSDLSKLIKEFLSQKTEEIVVARDLAEKLAKPTRTIKEEIDDIVTNNTDTTSPRIMGTYEVFKTEISENISPKDFADAFAQTLTYSLFLTKITSTSQEKLTLVNIENEIPKSFSLIKDILTFVKEIDKYPRLKPYIDKIFYIINNTNAFEVVKDLQNKKDEFEDAYIHFYENFLTAYDPVKRKDLGVWYTPKPVVRAIIDNIDKLLQKDFELAEGLANKGVKLLDFACGTGTFLFEVYEKILASLLPDVAKKDIIEDHILKNIFGFELLIPAYCVSHLKLSQYLKSKNYDLKSTERIGVYFTNTLENRTEKGQGKLENIFPAVAMEGREAQSIKDNNGILVITGNPPYNGSSLNNFEYIKNLIKPYFPKDGMKEKNPKWLQDDYVKFIRFAEDKIAKAGKGVVGIITNNGFLDNPTFRAMRAHLMETFDKIYIVDLHGSDRKKEKCPDGSKDENVFNIQQGVNISFFVKNDKIKDKGIYHMGIYGKRESKFKQINEIDLEASHFTKLEPCAPFYLFVPQDNTLRAKYEKGWSLRDIWVERVAGITTADDNFLLDFTSENLVKKINNKIGERIDNHFIKIVNYRPFDFRKVFYIQKKSDNPYKNLTIPLGYRPRADIMRHIIDKQNTSLVFVRNQQGTSYYDNVFISKNIIDLHLLPIGSYIAPLYLYTDNLGVEEKIINFKPEFLKMINERFNTPSPEQILAYIYAVLHSNNYRTKYLEFLKIDFPKIPFDVSIQEFKHLASLGQELIDAHLMKRQINVSYNEKIKFDQGKTPSSVVSKVNYREQTKRIYINDCNYFDNVSPAVWEFKIGGYQVLDKYLKSRKGMDIASDAEHLVKVIKTLQFTIEAISEIDGIDC